MENIPITTSNTENTPAKNRGLIGEFWSYLKIRKKWWLLPIIVMLVLIGALIILGQSSVLSPFIYSLF